MKFEKLKQRWREERSGKVEEARRRRALLLTRAKPVFEQYKLSKVVLFGSVAEGRCRKHSDTDLYVHPLAGLKYWDFVHDLEEAVQHPVDVYTEGDDRIFIDKIQDRGQVIYEI